MPQSKNAKRRKAIAQHELWIEKAIKNMKTLQIIDPRYEWWHRYIEDKRSEIQRIESNIARTPETRC